MNERIKQLAIQAGFFYEDYKDIWYLEYHNQSCEEEMKKFAELIVAKCVAHCEFVAGQAEITNTGEMARKTKATADSCAKMIREHFGVEE